MKSDRKFVYDFSLLDSETSPHLNTVCYCQTQCFNKMPNIQGLLLSKFGYCVIIPVLQCSKQWLKKTPHQFSKWNRETYDFPRGLITSFMQFDRKSNMVNFEQYRPFWQQFLHTTSGNFVLKTFCVTTTYSVHSAKSSCKEPNINVNLLPLCLYGNPAEQRICRLHTSFVSITAARYVHQLSSLTLLLALHQIFQWFFSVPNVALSCWAQCRVQTGCNSKSQFPPQVVRLCKGYLTVLVTYLYIRKPSPAASATPIPTLIQTAESDSYMPRRCLQQKTKPNQEAGFTSLKTTHQWWRCNTSNISYWKGHLE